MRSRNISYEQAYSVWFYGDKGDKDHKAQRKGRVPEGFFATRIAS